MTEFHSAAAAFLASADLGKHTRSPIKAPAAHDLSSLCATAKADYRKSYVDQRSGETKQYGKAPYQPLPGCSAKLLLKQAVAFGYEQNAWDDTSLYVVPVEGDMTGEACAANLGRFAQALRTTNGLAGFGSSWELSPVPEFGVVVFRQRSSIAD